MSADQPQRLTFASLVVEVATRTKLTQRDVRHVLATVRLVLAERVLVEGRKFVWPYFGVFYRSTSKARRVTLNNVDAVLPPRIRLAFRTTKDLSLSVVPTSSSTNPEEE